MVFLFSDGFKYRPARRYFHVATNAKRKSIDNESTQLITVKVSIRILVDQNQNLSQLRCNSIEKREGRRTIEKVDSFY